MSCFTKYPAQAAASAHEELAAVAGGAVPVEHGQVGGRVDRAEDAAGPVDGDRGQLLVREPRPGDVPVADGEPGRRDQRVAGEQVPVGPDRCATARCGADQLDRPIDVIDRVPQRRTEVAAGGPVGQVPPGGPVADGIEPVEVGGDGREGEAVQRRQPLADPAGQLRAGGAAVGAPADDPLVDADELALDLGEDLATSVEQRSGEGDPGRVGGQLDLDGPLQRPGVAVGVERAIEDLERVAAPVGVEAQEPVREAALDLDRSGRDAESELTGDGVEELGQR
ncbi:MAG: hypothetical protein AAFZ07_27825 [Actinomycetota bacterium]